MRKGLIPIVGGGRETGTSMLIEDVAVQVDKLGALTMDLIEMFQRHGYKDASCFGHALEGNLHLVFSQARSFAARTRPAAPSLPLSLRPLAIRCATCAWCCVCALARGLQ